MPDSARPNGSSAVLHLAVAQRLRALIVEGGIEAGRKLNERELAERLQVSRTPLREALKLLTAEGLVEHLPNRGATVVQLSADEVAHAFEVMAALEGLSGELACARVSAAEIAELQALNFEMRAHHARRDLPAYYRVNAQIHRAINRAARNPVLAQTYDRLNARLQALRFRSNFDAEKWDAAVREHDAMIGALVARDGEQLRRILVEHLQHKRDVVLAQLTSGALAGRPAAPGGSSAPAAAGKARSRRPAEANPPEPEQVGRSGPLIPMSSRAPARARFSATLAGESGAGGTKQTLEEADLRRAAAGEARKSARRRHG